MLPATSRLALFAWLLPLYLNAARRVYTACGGVYLMVALLWRWLVDGVRPAFWDLTAVAVALCGMSIIMFGPREDSIPMWISSSVAVLGTGLACAGPDAR
jgi:small multidrug resistance family-3 protein